MSKNYKFLVPAIVAAFALVLALALDRAAAQATLTGTWTAQPDTEKSDKLNLNFERRTERDGRSSTGQDYEFADLQGLTREQVSAGGAVRFSLVREAGRIDCVGSFQNGRGSGSFVFTPNPGFVSAMKERGFDFERDPSATDERRYEDRLFTAAALNVTTAQADDLLSAGFGRLGVEDLMKAAIFRVDSKFAREMKASGFQNLGLEELVKARIFKIDSEFARQVAQMGFDKEPFESLVKMRIFKITPEFIAEARNEGLANLSVEDLVKLRIFKIDAAFIRQAKAEGVPLEVESLVQKRIGVRTRSR